MFVAVNFPSAVRKALSRLVDRFGDDVPVRWTPEENFHLTLRWLGERDDHDRVTVSRVLEDVASGTEPFTARFGSLGAFPSPRRPRVIWIAVEGGPRLRLLRDELERRLAAAGYERDDRSFRPHVTLGRARPKASPGAFRDFPGSTAGLGMERTIPVDALDLMRSRPGEGPPVYERLSRSPLSP